MTRQKTFKRRVRARMAKTGESYTAARRMLIAGGDRPDAPTPKFKPWIAAERVRSATGRDWQGWFRLLDGWGATRHSHTEIARWLGDEHEVAGWWAQTITVGYEQARGLRAPGQNADGWVVNASKTIAVPVSRLFRAFQSKALRERWLPGARLRLRTATRPKSARYDWEDGTTRVVVGFAALARSKSQVAVAHERLPDAETAAEMKAWWRQRVVALKALLEGGASDA